MPTTIAKDEAGQAVSSLAPPPVAPRRAHVGVCRALSSYTKQNDTELSFSENDIIYVLDKTSDPDNWHCRIDRATGSVRAALLAENSAVLENPVHEAAKRGNVAFLRELMTSGVSVNGLDAADNTPLHWAARGGHEECVAILLSVGAVLNCKNKLGDTPFHSVASCASSSAVNIARLLLESDAETALEVVRAKNNMGEMAAQIAKDVDVAAVLVQASQKHSRSSQIAESADSDSE